MSPAVNAPVVRGAVKCQQCGQVFQMNGVREMELSQALVETLRDHIIREHAESRSTVQ